MIIILTICWIVVLSVASYLVVDGCNKTNKNEPSHKQNELEGNEHNNNT